MGDFSQRQWHDHVTASRRLHGPLQETPGARRGNGKSYVFLFLFYCLVNGKPSYLQAYLLYGGLTYLKGGLPNGGLTYLMGGLPNVKPSYLPDVGPVYLPNEGLTYLLKAYLMWGLGT